MKRACLLIVLCFGLVSASNAGSTGKILFEHYWTNGQATLDALFNTPSFPSWPDSVELRTSLEGPIDWRDSYGTRVRGYLVPPQDGSYTFWIASDDQSQLWLSSDSTSANAVQIASVSGWTPSRDFDNLGGGQGGTQQKSSPIPLKAGIKYFIKVFQIEGQVGDNLAVAWQGPGIPNREIIQGQYLMPFGGLKGEYFTNMTLSGSPAYTRNDPEINFSWGTGEIFPGTSDGCSAQWSGEVEVPSTESYTFYVSADDGVHLWLDGNLIINAWWDQAITEYASAAIPLTAGKRYPIRLEWYENTGFADCQLRWSSPSTPKQIIPSDRLGAVLVDPVAPGLVGWWKCDEGAGTTVQDSSGYGHDGILKGNVAWTQGPVGKALSFAGNLGDYVDIGTWNPSEATGQMTLSHWLYWSGTGNTWQGTIGKRDSWNQNDMMWQIELTTNSTPPGEIIFKREQDERAYRFTMPANQWVHVAVTFDGTNSTLYRDGQPIGTAPFAFGFDTTAAMTIGACEGGGGNPWTGSIDDVRIYNRALSWGEVIDLAVFYFSGGNGTPSTPYRISTVADWQMLASWPSRWDKQFILTADLDLAGVPVTPVGNSIPFTGVFDGRGHVIRNAVINLPGTVGLFAAVGPSGQILNLGVENVNITGGSIVGGLVGTNSGRLFSCYATGSVQGTADVGGLVGWQQGLVDSCYAAVSVSALGGLTPIGGLAGYNDTGGSVIFSYANGTVSGSRLFGGGLCEKNFGPIDLCFWDTQTSGTTFSAGGTGKSTAEMKTRSTFTDAGWDFTGETANGTADIWRMCVDGVDYPRLSWEYPRVGDFECPDGVGPEDLLYLAARWLAATPATVEAADATGDGTVDLEDFAILAAHWQVMAVIPAGTFSMGNSKPADDLDGWMVRELPVHTVTLDSFYMDRYDITNGQYCAFLNSAYPSQLKVVNGTVYARGDTGNSFPYCDTSSAPVPPPDFYSDSQIAFSNNIFSVRTKGGRDMSRDPMVMVTWYGAAAYCNWRSQQEGRDLCYNLSTWSCDFAKKGYRLPTEAEWEYAARGGLSSQRFPWGDTISHSQANYKSDSSYSYDISPTRGYHPAWNDGIKPYTSPVGSFPANGYGLCDMADNVMEWCNDWYSETYYSFSPVINPTGPTTGNLRVVRGGNWDIFAPYCRESYRVGGSSNITYNYIGFRVVLDFN